MWYFLRSYLILTFLGIVTCTFGQNNNDQYHSADTIILKDFLELRIGTIRERSADHQNLSIHILDLAQCMADKFPENNDVYWQYHQTLLHYHLNYSNGDTTGLFSINYRKRMETEILNRFGYYSMQMHFFYQGEAYKLIDDGKEQEAIKCMYRDFEIRKQIYPTCHPFYSSAYTLGDFFERIDMVDSSIYWFKESANWSRSEMGDMDPTHACAWLRIGNLLIKMAEFDSASMYLEEYLSQQKKYYENSIIQTENLQWTYHNLLKSLLVMENSHSDKLDYYLDEYYNFIKQIKHENIKHTLKGNTERRIAAHHYQRDSIDKAIESCKHAIHSFLYSFKEESNRVFPANIGLSYCYMLLSDIYAAINKQELSKEYFTLALTNTNIHRQINWDIEFQKIDRFNLIQKRNGNLNTDSYFSDDYKRKMLKFVANFKSNSKFKYTNCFVAFDYFAFCINHDLENCEFCRKELFTLCSEYNKYIKIHNWLKS